MITKRFLISWLSTSLVMFLSSYVWHNFVLTDYSRLTYPIQVFLIAAAVVYLIIGFIVAKAIDFKMFENKFKRKPILRGSIAGALCGIAFFLIATVVGVSFSTSASMENLLLDVTWQTIEQAIGGMVVGIAHLLVFDPSVLMQED